MMRRGAESARAGAGASAAFGDPVKTANLMIGTVDQFPAPKRVAMGSDIYDALLSTYRERATFLEAQKDLTCSADF
jgi:hypothetical protein